MIRIDFSDIDPSKIEAELIEQIADDLNETIEDIYNDLTAPAPLGTPVDQGTARNGWQIDDSVKLAPEVYNMTPYIGRLNAGHSKKSPAGFVDAIVDRHTR